MYRGILFNYNKKLIIYLLSVDGFCGNSHFTTSKLQKFIYPCLNNIFQLLFNISLIKPILDAQKH